MMTNTVRLVQPIACANCGHRMVRGAYRHETKIGVFTVHDAYGVDGCEHCQEKPSLTFEERRKLEWRAARTVLLRASKVDGETIRFTRKSLGFTQKELSQLFDLTKETISRWETNAEPIRRVTQLALASIVAMAEMQGIDALRLTFLQPSLVAPQQKEFSIPG